MRCLFDFWLPFVLNKFFDGFGRLTFIWNSRVCEKPVFEFDVKISNNFVKIKQNKWTEDYQKYIYQYIFNKIEESLRLQNE